MCTLVTLFRPGHDWPLVIGTNRDEMTDRPWQPPARHWPDRATVIAGRDELAGGTWLGMNDDRVIAGVLNRKDSLGPADDKRSRGELPLEALDHASAADAAEALAHIDPASYRSFNLVVADAEQAFWLRSLGGGNGLDHVPVSVSPIPSGISMITAYDLNDTNGSRTKLYLPQFRKAAEPDVENGDWAAWQALFASRVRDADAGTEGALCIVTDFGYGTVSSSLMALPRTDRIDVKPVWRFAAGRPGEAIYEPIAL